MVNDFVGRDLVGNKGRAFLCCFSELLKGLMNDIYRCLLIFKAKYIIVTIKTALPAAPARISHACNVLIQGKFN